MIIGKYGFAVPDPQINIMGHLLDALSKVKNAVLDLLLHPGAKISL